jgi:hypothetical protein
LIGAYLHFRSILRRSAHSLQYEQRVPHGRQEQARRAPALAAPGTIRNEIVETRRADIAAAVTEIGAPRVEQSVWLTRFHPCLITA